MPPHSQTPTSNVRRRSRRWPVLVWILVLALWVVVTGRSAAGPSLSFAAAHAYSTGSDPVSVAVADVDRNGKPDLLTANRDANSVSVLLNAGTGFATKVDYAVGEAPASLAVADLNGDSSPDVAVANQSEAGISLLLNDGNGDFFRFGVPTIGVPDSVAIADLNGDGWADFVNANSSIGESTVSVSFQPRPRKLPDRGDTRRSEPRRQRSLSAT